jgi:hypothetical protein
LNTNPAHLGTHFCGSRRGERSSPLLFNMDFPSTWVVLQLDQFDTALPDIQGDITVELLAHLRSTGRALDHFRFSLNGPPR